MKKFARLGHHGDDDEPSYAGLVSHAQPVLRNITTFLKNLPTAEHKKDYCSYSKKYVDTKIVPKPFIRVFNICRGPPF